jgi:YebC/PmpR family DNA-binding regulatory protein
MSGHSKWSTIKRKKGEKDASRAKIFTKISREIMVCVKQNGGADPDNNSKLREIIAKARSNNIPNDNIERLLKKIAGGNEKSEYENCVYEGYGPNGVAVMVDCLTDNKNRTAGEIRHYFSKYGGNMGAAGCVSFMFAPKGIIVIDLENNQTDFDTILEQVLDAGGDDVSISDEDGENVAEVECNAETFRETADKLSRLGYKIISAETAQVPSTYTTLTDEEHIRKMTAMLEVMEDYDDVQNVWHNWQV